MTEYSKNSVMRKITGLGGFRSSFEASKRVKSKYSIRKVNLLQVILIKQSISQVNPHLL